MRLPNIQHRGKFSEFEPDRAVFRLAKHVSKEDRKQVICTDVLPGELPAMPEEKVLKDGDTLLVTATWWDDNNPDEGGWYYDDPRGAQKALDDLFQPPTAMDRLGPVKEDPAKYQRLENYPTKFLQLFEDKWAFLSKKIPEPEQLNQVLRADPTSQDTGGGPDGQQVKAGKYSDWIVKHYLRMRPAAQQRFQREDWEKTRDDLFVYHRAKAKLGPDMRDINQAVQGQGEQAFIDLYTVVDAIREQGADKTDKEKATEGIVVLWDDADWLVAVPKTYEAMRALGTKTRWCNYANESYFDDYARGGESFVILHKNRDKYQLHWPSGQFMDAEDSRIKVDELLPSLPPGAKESMFKYALGGMGMAQEYQADLLCSIDIQSGVEVIMKRGWEDEMQKVNIKAAAVAGNLMTKEQASSPGFEYTDNMSVWVKLGDEDSDLSELTAGLAKDPDSLDNCLTGEAGTYWNDEYSSWDEEWDEISEGAMKEILAKVNELIEEGELDKREDEPVTPPTNDSELKDLLTDDPLDDFHEVRKALRWATDDAMRSAYEHAWYKAALDVLKAKVGSLEYRDGWKVEVPITSDLVAVAQERGEELIERGLLYTYCEMIKEEEGEISSGWGDYGQPWEPIDKDYFSERISDQLYDI